MEFGILLVRQGVYLEVTLMFYHQQEVGPMTFQNALLFFYFPFVSM
jgi:hypothetical protein